MNLLPKPLRQALRVLPPVAVPAPHPGALLYRATVLQAPPLADELAQAREQAGQEAERMAARGCGWFDSSFELRQGLAVSESCDAGWAEWDAWTAAAQDWVRLEPSSAQLQ